MLAETDRDKYCVQQIIDFYRRQNTDYADYFQAAWRFKHRAALGRPDATLADVAADAKVSAKYLATVWSMLEEHAGRGRPARQAPGACGRQLPAPGADAAGRGRGGLRADARVRRAASQEGRAAVPEPRPRAAATPARQPLLMWKNVQYATHRMTFDPAQLQVEGEAAAGRSTSTRNPAPTASSAPAARVPVVNAPGDPDLVVPAGRAAALRGRVRAVLPRLPRQVLHGGARPELLRRHEGPRPLPQRRLPQPDGLLPRRPAALRADPRRGAAEGARRAVARFDFIASATDADVHRSSAGRASRGRAAVTRDAEADAAEPEDRRRRPPRRRITAGSRQPTSPRREGGEPPRRSRRSGDYFGWINRQLRSVEKARVDAEPSTSTRSQHFAAARLPPAADAGRAATTCWRYYTTVREKDGLDHEAAMRESIVSVLMSPDFCYRIDLLEDRRRASHRCRITSWPAG